MGAIPPSIGDFAYKTLIGTTLADGCYGPPILQELVVAHGRLLNLLGQLVVFLAH